jgi:hypothetical protein
MSYKSRELPRDLRALCGAFEEDEDGTYRILLDPVRAYANVVAVRRDLERDIADPDCYSENRKLLDRQIEFVKREQTTLKQRILDHFKPRSQKQGANAEHPFPKVDQGVKNKVVRFLHEIEEGTYDPNKASATLRAVRQALDFELDHGRMPFPHELRRLGYTNQQTADAGIWFSEQNEAGDDSLFSKMKEARGRRKKK